MGQALRQPRRTQTNSPQVLERGRANTVFLKDSWRSWVVCFAGFLLQVLVVGFLHAFGVFFAFFIQEFKSTKQATAWIGSIAYGLTNTFGPLVGLLQNRFGNRIVSMTGSAICVISLTISSFATNLETLFGTFSVLYGIGAALAYTPTMNLANDYFDRHVSFATGFMVAGSSVGTLILSPLAQALLKQIGWQNTFRVFAGLIVTTVWSGWIFGWKPDENPYSEMESLPQTVPVVADRGLARFIRDISLWKDRVFVNWTIALSLVMFGYYIPYMHLVTYSEDLGLSAEKGSSVVMTLGASTAIGRVMFGRIAQMRVLHRLHMHQASMILTGMASMLLPLIMSYGGLLTYVILIGLVDGCFVVLLPQITTMLMGKENANVAWGFLIGATSLTFAAGPPVAGYLRDVTGSYNLSFHVAGVPVVLGGLMLFFIPWAKRTANNTALPEAAEMARSQEQQEVVDCDNIEREFSEAVFNVDQPVEFSIFQKSEEAYRVRRQKSKELEMVIASTKEHGLHVPKRRRCISESHGCSSTRAQKAPSLETMRKPLPTITEVKQTSGGTADSIVHKNSSDPSSNESNMITEHPTSCCKSDVSGNTLVAVEDIAGNGWVHQMPETSGSPNKSKSPSPIHSATVGATTGFGHGEDIALTTEDEWTQQIIADDPASIDKSLISSPINSTITNTVIPNNGFGQVGDIALPLKDDWTQQTPEVPVSPNKSLIPSPNNSSVSNTVFPNNELEQVGDAPIAGQSSAGTAETFDIFQISQNNAMTNWLDEKSLPSNYQIKKEISEEQSQELQAYCDWVQSPTTIDSINPDDNVLGSVNHIVSDGLSSKVFDVSPDDKVGLNIFASDQLPSVIDDSVNGRTRSFQSFEKNDDG